MAFSDYEAFVFVNGTRLEEAEGSLLRSVEQAVQLLTKANAGLPWFHATLGDNQVQLCAYKTTPALYIAGVEVGNFYPDADNWYDWEAEGIVSGYRWRLRYITNQLDLWLIAPDGTVWAARSGYSDDMATDNLVEALSLPSAPAHLRMQTIFDYTAPQIIITGPNTGRYDPDSMPNALLVECLPENPADLAELAAALMGTDHRSHRLLHPMIDGSTESRLESDMYMYLLVEQPPADGATGVARWVHAHLDPAMPDGWAVTQIQPAVMPVKLDSGNYVIPSSEPIGPVEGQPIYMCKLARLDRSKTGLPVPAPK